MPIQLAPRPASRPRTRLAALRASRARRLGLFLGALCVFATTASVFFYVSTRSANTTYFSRANGLAPELVASWSSTRDGLGTPPPNFTSGDTFVIQNGHNMTNAAAWLISGTNSKLHIESGGTLTANNTVDLAAATTFQIDGGGTYVHNNAAAFGSTIFQGTESFAPTSTVILNNSNTTGPSGVAFGNLTVNFTTPPGASVQLSGNISTVNGNLTFVNTQGQEFRLTANSNVTLTIGGNLVIQGGTVNLSSGTGVPTINVGGDYNQTGGTLTSTGSGIGSINFTGGSSFVTFAQSAGTLTNTNINWSIANGKTVQFNNAFTLPASRIFNVNAGGMLLAAAAVTNGGTVNVFGDFRLTDGGSAAGTDFTYGANGTLSFTTAGGYAVSGTPAYWPATNGPQNVNVIFGGINMSVARTVGGLFQYSSGVSGAGNLTLNGTSQVNAGGFMSGSPTYGSSSLLKYNTGANYGRNGEWLPGVTSGAGYPNTVQISNTTTLDLPSGSTGSTFQTAAGLQIDSGSTLNMGAMSQALTVRGSVQVDGTLTLSTATGGDIKVGGSWTRNSATGTFTPNGRAVIFNGSVLQTIQVFGGGTETFNYLVVNNGANNTVSTDTFFGVTNVTVNGTSGDVLQLLGGHFALASGTTLTLSGNGGNVLAGGGARSVLGQGAVNFTGSKTVTSASGGALAFGNTLPVNLSAGVDFGPGVSTVNGVLSVKTGGFVNTNPPVYAVGSTLEYDNGTTFDAAAEFPANGVHNVSLSTTTQLNLNGDKTVGGSFLVADRIVGSTAATPFSINANTLAVGGGTVNVNNLTATSTLAGTGTINVAGDWNVTGFNAGSSTVNFNGTGAQSILQPGGTFANLTASNDITLGASITLNGTLALGSKKITTGAHTLQLVGASAVTRTTGYVIGTLQKDFNAPASFTFHVGTANGYSPVEANGTTGAGTLSVRPTQTKLPAIAGADALSRFWTLSGSGITTSLTFNYLDGDVNVTAPVTEADYKVFKFSSPATMPPSQTLDADNNRATVNGVSSFSDWTLATAAAVNGEIRFAQANTDDGETNADHSVNVAAQRAGGSSGEVSVTYAITDGTATTAGNDYAPPPTPHTLTWADGDTADKHIPVTVKGDTTFEPDETVNLSLSDPTGGAVLGSPSTSTLTITNDDTRPLPGTVYVDDDWANVAAGADPDGAGPATEFGYDAFSTIQGGVTAVADPGTVIVGAGIYTETVTVGKQLSLRGAQYGVDARTRSSVPESVVNGTNGSFILAANNIALDGFTVQDAAGTTAAGITTNVAASGYQVRNNIIKDNRIGLYLRSSGTIQSVVEQNLVRDNNKTGGTNNGNGLFSDGTFPGLSNALAQNNRFAGSHAGATNAQSVNLTNSNNLTFTANEFVDGSSVLFTNVDNSSFTNNTLTGTHTPLTFTGLRLATGSDNMTVTGNSFLNRGTSAFSASQLSTLTFSNNTVTFNVSVVPVNSTRAIASFNGLMGTSTVSENSVTLSGVMPSGASVHGMEVSGNNTATVNVTRNTLDGGNTDPIVAAATDSYGLFLSPSGFGLPSPVVTVVNATNNIISGWVDGVAVVNFTGAGQAVGVRTTLNVNNNNLNGNSNRAIRAANTGATIDASANWIGSAVPATVNGKITGTAVDYTPFLNVGTDTASGTAGFQGDFSSLTVHAAGNQFGTAGRIQEGIGLVNAGGTVKVLTGAYAGNVDATAKAVTLAAGASPGQVTVNGNLTLSGDDTLAVEIEGTDAATQYDNFVVNGTVTLGDATLALSGVHTPVAGQTFTLVSNDSTDAVAGTFANLPEGAIIQNFLGSDLDAQITYAGGSNANDVLLTVLPNNADLTLAKTDSHDPATVGNALTYTLALSNAGPDAATNVVLTDTLPGGVTFVSAATSQGTCSGTETVTCNLGTINNGAGATVRIVVTPNTPGTITNQASAAATEADSTPAADSEETLINDAVCTAPPAGMTGWWRGDGDASDSVGSTNIIISHDDATFAAGKVNQAFTFDGSGDYVSQTLPSNVKTPNITMDAWVNLATVSSSGVGQVIVAAQPRGANGTGLGAFLSVNPDGRATFTKGANGPFVNLTGTTVLSADTWYHVAGTYDGATMRVYVNGVEENSLADGQGISWADAAAGNNYPDPAQLYFGAYKTNQVGSGATVPDSGFLNGRVDEIEIFSRALSANEVLAIYSAGGAGKCNTLSYVVNSTNDPGTGACDAAECTLREAVAAANSDVGPETITFQIPQNDPGCPQGVCTINLQTALPALSSMAIQGTGANLLTVRRSTAQDTPNFRIFFIGLGETVSISGLTISNGRAVGDYPDGSGAGIFNHGNLTLTNSTVSGNVSERHGGGIYTDQGGAPSVNTVSVANSTFTDNQVLGPGQVGGGLMTSGPTVTVTNSTFSGNSAPFGGGLMNNAGTTTITSSTIVNNASTEAGNSGGGGIRADGGTNTILRNTIVANNTTASAGPDLWGTFTSQGYNLIEDTSAATVNGDTSTNIMGADPVLGPLAANGGPTQTHAVLVCSPAIDNGNDFSESATTDQRGEPRPFDSTSVTPTTQGGDNSDIGAYELQSSPVCNTAPAAVAPDPAPTVAEDAPGGVQITLTGTDAENNTLTFTITEGPADGDLDKATGTPLAADSCATGTCTLVVTYTPDANFNGPDSFKFKVNDGALDSNEATVSITVTAVNDPPVVATPTATPASINEGASATISASFTDPDASDTHTATIDCGNTTSASNVSVTEPTGSDPGSVSGTCAYADDDADDTFTATVTVNDSAQASDGETVSVTVQNVAPTVAAVTAAPTPAPEGQSVTVSASFTDPGTPDTHTATLDCGDGTAASGMSVNQADNTATGNCTYADDGNYTATVNVSDDDGGSDSDTVSVTVTNVAPAAAATPNPAEVVENTSNNTSVQITLTGADVPADPITFRITDGPDNGTLSQPTDTDFSGTCSNGTCTATVTYTPAPGYFGPDSFTFSVGDGDGGSDGEIVTINVLEDADADGVPDTLDACANTPAGSTVNPAGCVADHCYDVDETAMVAWYPGDGDATDIQGPAFEHGALHGDSSFAAGRVGQSFSLDGQGDYVNVPHSTAFDLSAALTVDVWIKATQADFDAVGPHAAIVTKGDSAWRLQRGPGANGYALRFGSNHPGFHDLDGDIHVADGQWHHVAAVFDGATNTKYLYVDGVLDASATVAGPIATNSSDVRIGENSEATGRFFRGQIDEVEIFSRALSANELRAIYFAGGEGKCGAPGADDDNDNVTNVNDACPATAAGTTVNAAGCPADQCFAPPAGMIAWYPAGGAANDARGPTLENGTLVGASASAAGKVGQAFSFNGTSHRIDVPHDDALNPAALTVDAWINPANTTNDRSIVFKGSHQYVLKLRNGKVVFGSKDSSDTYSEFTGAITVPTNAWTHVAVTHDGQTRRIYVNGARDGAASPQDGLLTTDTTTMRIGRHGTAALEFFSGRIDEVQLFGRALSSAEINAIYLADTRGKCRPAAPSAPDLQEGSDTGANSDNVTADTSPAFDIAGVTPGATVELLRNGSVVASGVPTGATISLEDADATVGTHLYAARQLLADIYGPQSAPLSVRIDTSPPSVGFIGRNGSDPVAPGSSVEFLVIFTESVTGVDATDFFVTTTGTISGATVTGVTGSGPNYVVTVDTNTGSGTVRLDLIDDDTIADGAGNKLGGEGAANGNFTTGHFYTIPTGLFISDMTQAEGNAGQTAFTFSVTLDLPAPQNGVSFKVSTADGANDPANDGDDYAGFANQDGFIAEGQTSTTVTVMVSGDTTREEDETFFVNLTEVVGASSGDLQGIGTILNDDGAPSAGQVIISEFRLRGAAPSGTPAPGNEQGQLDEFVELYNNTDAEIVVADPSPAAGANGWALVSSDDPANAKYVVPAGTRIPARGHLLVANAGYSLGGYSGEGTLSYEGDIPDGAGLTLLRTANPAAAAEDDRLDSVGFAQPEAAANRPSAAALAFYEGTPLLPAGGITAPAEHSFVRKLTSGRPADTEDNRDDFVFVSTDGGSYDGAQSVLGAPGPEGVESPIQRNLSIKSGLIDSQQPYGESPNSVRKQCDEQPEECDESRSKFGTFSIRRRWTNGTGLPVTRLRFRIVNVTTLNSPGYSPGATQADLRALSSQDVTDVQVTGVQDPVTVQGTTLETPPAQDLGGGLNATLAAGAVTVDEPLIPGRSINLQFLLGVKRPGAYAFFVNVEALTGDPPPESAPSKAGAARPKAGKPKARQ